MPSSSMKINVDNFVSSGINEFVAISTVLETTKLLDRLYGRSLAKKFFTSHLSFDNIKVA